ncbi:glycosyltransferase [Neobacillus sp. D3-1R]|uniref:glycosyltransferase n=1 Tax=Neobacillus sp. D3-1R TaxID=3445778 RepID=UPI003F9EEC7D
MKKKILFVAPNLQHGGAEAVLVKILNNLDLSKYDVKLALVKKEGDHLSKLTKAIDVIDLNSSKSILAIPKLIKLIKNIKPDFVFSIIGQVNIILATIKTLFFKKTCFIGRENAVYSEWLFKDLTIKKRIFSIVYKILLRKLDYVIVQSNFMAGQVKEYFNVKDNQVIILNNPIEGSKISDLSNETNLGNIWDENKINLIAVGRIEQVKNYREMVDIVSMLPEKFHLNILGDGRERETLQEYINQKGLYNRVTIHGFIDNPYKYMKNSLVLLITSKRESFPNVVLESNACGTYVVSYNMPGGISEIITNGKNGDLIPEGDKALFVQKLIGIYKRGYDPNILINYSRKYSIKEYINKLDFIFERSK